VISESACLGPFPWPFFGNRYYLQKLTRRLGGQHFAFLELSKIYNSDIISLRLGTNDMIIVSGSKFIHEICLNEKYDGRPWNEFTKLRNMGLKKKGKLKFVILKFKIWLKINFYIIYFNNIKNYNFIKHTHISSFIEQK